MNEKLKLDLLLHNLRVCEEAVLAELEVLYPVGCDVEYRLREGVPTRIGQVTRHIGGREAAMRVLLAPNPRGTDSTRDQRYETTLPASKIIRRINPSSAR